jgi:CBS domain-containing protein
MNVTSLMTPHPIICTADTNLAEAAALMLQGDCGILPVVHDGTVLGFGGTVIGIVSMNDLVLAAGAKKPVRGADIVDTMQHICSHHHPAPHVEAA